MLSRFFDLLNSMIDDLKRSVDLRWLFDPVLHSSINPLVLNAEEPFNPRIRAWLGRYTHICFYFCGLWARCVWFWPQKSTQWLISVQSKLHPKIFMIHLKYTNVNVCRCDGDLKSRPTHRSASPWYQFVTHTDAAFDWNKYAHLEDVLNDFFDWNNYSHLQDIRKEFLVYFAFQFYEALLAGVSITHFAGRLPPF